MGPDRVTAQPQEQLSVGQAIARGIQYHQAGNLDAASQVYEAVLNSVPDEPDALHLLGVVRDQQGKGEEAITLITQALALQPDHAEAHNNLGLAYQAQGKLDDALRHFNRAVKIAPDYAQAHYNCAALARARHDPDLAEEHYRKAVGAAPQFAEAHFNLGNLYKNSERLFDAAASYRNVIALKPQFAEVHNNLGIVLHMQGEFEPAIACYREAVRLRDGYTEAWSNLARALRDSGQEEEALKAYRKALTLANPGDAAARIAHADGLAAEGRRDLALVEYQRAIVLQEPDNILAKFDLANALAGITAHRLEAIELYKQVVAAKPDYLEAYNNLGSVLNAQGQWDDALACYDKAIAVDPERFQTHLNMGNLLMKLMRWDDAEAAYERAVTLAPDNAPCARAMGGVLQRKGRWKEAMAEFHRAVALDPNYAEAHQNIGLVQQGLGQLDEAMQSYRRALEIAPDYDGCRSALLFAMHNDHRCTPQMIFDETAEWAERVNAVCPHGGGLQNSADPERRLRVGYVSSDLRNHPVGVFLESVIAQHDPSHVEVYCYAHQTLYDDQSERLITHSDHWRPIFSYNDEQLAALIQQDGIDILVDLNGHTANSRLRVFACKPAPVQMTWMGYFNTTGLKEMDYIIADRFVIPPGQERYYSEQPIRMPDSYLCFTLPHHLDVKVATLPAIANKHITFGCFNYATKISPPVVALWAKILHRIPDAQLFLKTQAFEDEGVVVRYCGHFAEHGIPSNRLIFEGPTDRKKLLESYAKVDISLDPFPYNGGTTTVEALWMGVPVIAMSGDRFVSNVSNTILHTTGFADWVCENEDTYLEKAVALASDIPALAAIRSGMRAQVEASPICNAPRFTHNLEQAYRDAWREWCRKQNS